MTQTLDLTDSAAFAAALISRPSITPTDAGALDVLQRALEQLGFTVTRLPFGEVDNLYARLGDRGPNLCFAGHTDVVPPGEEGAWTSPPFQPVVRDGAIWGRGAADMKGAIAAFVAAIARLLKTDGAPEGSISLLITGDEEGPAINGTVKVLEALKARGERIDHCIVGEPTSGTRLGDCIKIGRRGSLNAHIMVEGRQGHVAYPERAANPVPILLDILQRLRSRGLDDGPVPHFQPSNLEVTSVDVGNTTTNVIPAKAEARLNIRFNVAHQRADLQAWIERETAAATTGVTGGAFEGRASIDFSGNGDAFITPPGPFVDLVSKAVEAETDTTPVLSTGGGTSDARFIKDAAPVLEFGLVGASMHKVDEHARLDEMEALTRIYHAVLRAYHPAFAIAPA